MDEHRQDEPDDIGNNFEGVQVLDLPWSMTYFVQDIYHGATKHVIVHELNEEALLLNRNRLAVEDHLPHLITQGPLIFFQVLTRLEKLEVLLPLLRLGPSLNGAIGAHLYIVVVNYWVLRAEPFAVG
uniref:Uncharacterized protein n=1 Tax=Strombidium inclinatum TaxID=197538 RepID=A0A7S3IL65_9SPIT